MTINGGPRCVGLSFDVLSMSIRQIKPILRYLSHDVAKTLTQLIFAYVVIKRQLSVIYILINVYATRPKLL